MISKWIRILAAVFTATALSACGGDDDDHPPPTPNIVGTAQADARFSILVEAVTAAGLGDALSQPGPLTVFAPTNDAFAALLAELGLTKAQLLADKPLLTAVLQYHVLGSRVAKAQVPLGKAITPLAGGIFKVDSVGSDLVVTDGRNRTAKITATDVAASNGVVHVIDKVLLPPNRNIVQTAQALPQFSILVEAVVAADLVGALSGAGPLTVFAPTDTAFAALLTELGTTKAALLANKPLLTQVLTYHVLNSRVLKADVPVGSAITTLQGGSFSVDATLAITDARNRKAAITGTDVLTSNGVVHVIDKVILPAP
ncbi:MAG: fasciclin domain-containing protein [Rubrivivax sp.]|nr:fasciclin domain-containing protein [Rubrivivax sp.]